MINNITARRYHQEYWQKWRPRYALLAGLISVQYFDVLDRTGDNVCTALALALALVAVGERAVGGGVKLGT